MQTEPEQWEDRCRDCDDTGITIQTERLCACQPVQPKQEPEQWAELRNTLKRLAEANQDYLIDVAIQRAFEEQTRKLREALEEQILEVTNAIAALDAVRGKQ